MKKVPVYVLVTLGFSKAGEVTRKNIGVTFNVHEAEAHAAADVANEYETHEVEAEYREDIEVTALSLAMRDFRDMVQQMQEEAVK